MTLAIDFLNRKLVDFYPTTPGAIGLKLLGSTFDPLTANAEALNAISIGGAIPVNVTQLGGNPYVVNFSADTASQVADVYGYGFVKQSTGEYLHVFLLEGAPIIVPTNGTINVNILLER